MISIDRYSWVEEDRWRRVEQLTMWIMVEEIKGSVRMGSSELQDKQS